jgi:hypothetical protein
VRVEEIEEDTVLLSNGAAVTRTGWACEVCVKRNEEAGASEFMVEFEGQQIHVCAAHTQQILDMDEDQKGGDEFTSLFGVKEESET